MAMRFRSVASVFAGLALAALASGCATPPDRRDAAAVKDFEEANDPAEPTMRAIFAFNRALDTALVKPLARAYRELPDEVRQSVNNALNNLRAPVTLLNDVLQGSFERAGTTLARLVINSTLGVGGLRDPAATVGYRHHSEDFGQTLAVWGVAEGPYVVLPILGPSNPRDAVGLAVDFLTDPLNLWATLAEQGWVIYSRSGMRGVDERARNYDALEDLEKGALDYYVAIRNLYRQRRADEISNGGRDIKMPAPSLGMLPTAPRQRSGDAAAVR